MFCKRILLSVKCSIYRNACNNYKHLKYLKLANYHRDDEYLEIDILLGANYYWSITEDKIIRGFEGPIALKSKVGYVQLQLRIIVK